jgi:hypothetical protein
MSTPSRSRRRRGAVATLAAAATACVVAGASSGRPAQKPENVCALETTERIVAVGDVHGAYERFATILQEAKIIDADRHWIGEKTILVQTGDMMDRGPDSRKAIDLLRRLEGEAAKAGGKVRALIGNHEAMRVQEFLRDASQEEAGEFRTPTSEKMRGSYYFTASDAARAAALRINPNKPFDEKAFKQSFLDVTPLGYVEMMKAFNPDGEYGKWIRGHDAMIKINGILFMHGGANTAISALGCAAVNAKVHQELSRVSPPWDDKMLIWRNDGPLWYRGLVSRDPEGAYELATPKEFDAILAKLKANAIVLGHTTFGTAKITGRRENRLFPIDTGMLGGVNYSYGEPSALEITGDTWTAIYVGKREVLKK